MDEIELKRCDKTTLKNMALNRGLDRTGYNGRNLSRMRKQDFIDYILHTDDNDTSEEFEEELLGFILSQIRTDDALDPILHIFNALNNLSERKEPSENKKVERIPNEEDEQVPKLMINKDHHTPEEISEVKTNLVNLETKITCVVCLTHLRNVAFAPCNHLATCISCSKNSLLTKCPLCRKEFTGTTRIFAC
jgi:hypothetical protein